MKLWLGEGQDMIYFMCASASFDLTVVCVCVCVCVCADVAVNSASLHAVK